MRLYFAAPLAWAGYAREVSAEVSRVGGHGIVSSWHDRVLPGAVDPSAAEERSAILLANLADLRAAGAVVALTHVGTPRATFGELGFALALGKPVVWCHGAGGEGRCILDADHMVRRIVVEDADGWTVAARVVSVLAGWTA